MAFTTKFGLFEEIPLQDEASPEPVQQPGDLPVEPATRALESGHPIVVEESRPAPDFEQHIANLHTETRQAIRYETANAENPVCGNIDSCILETSGDKLMLHIRGWMFHIKQDSPMIQFAVPNSSLILAQRLRRDDVAINFPTKSNALHSGFDVCIPLESEPDDGELLYFLMTLTDGLTISGCLPLPLIERRDAPSPRGTAHSSQAILEAHYRLLQTRLTQLLESELRLQLPRSLDPRVSIVIPLFNRAECTAACLQSIIDTCRENVEVILIDNNSEDATGDLLAIVDGATVIRNEENLHYLRACNQGSQIARGEFLLFLNSDTVLCPGALASAVATLESHSDIGAVGARLIRPDGLLQEAGGIIWNDGSTAAYGRGESPSDMQYLFQRTVDYCSGAFLLTSRRVFTEVGMFNERYIPAYYEDADYCLELEARGLRTVYEPRATVLHAESSSSDPTSASSLQIQNRRTFREIRHRQLSSRLPRSERNMDTARSRASSLRHILYIDDQIPAPEKGSGFPRAKLIIDALLEAGMSITFATTQVVSEEANEVYQHLDRQIEVVSLLEESSLRKYLERKQQKPDVVFIARPHNVEILREGVSYAREMGVKVVYDAEAIYATRECRKDAVLGVHEWSENDIQGFVEKEVRETGLGDIILAVNDTEANHFRRYQAAPVHVASYGLDVVDRPLPFEARSGLLTVGPMFEDDSPNTDAVAWFCEQVSPFLQSGVHSQSTEHLRLQVIGDCSAPCIRSFQGPDVLFRGSSTDINQFLDTSRVFIAPARFSSGIPLKVLHAASRGIPAVASRLIAEQLGWQDGFNILVADDPKAFAEQCIRLHSDRELWNEISRNALTTVAEKYSTEEFKQIIVEAVSQA